MRIIKKEVDYAIRSVIFIHKMGGFSKACEIYKEINAPKSFLRKILQTLAKNNILKSIKGRNGGFKLEKNIKEINLSDITYLFTEKPKRGMCPFKTPICLNSSRCKLKFRIGEIEEKIQKELSKIRLYELVEVR